VTETAQQAGHTFDWTSQEFLRDPYVHYKRMRETNPIHFNEARGSWILTRYNDMADVLRDHDRFSAERGGPANYSTDEMPRSMLASDPPHHTRLRTLVNKAFTARTVERLRQRIQQIVDGLLDDVADQGGMEAITDFAYPLPITVIAEMLGVPASDRDFFRDASSKIAVALGPINDISVGMAALEGRNQLIDYFNDLIPKRRGVRGSPTHDERDPRDDLISAMLAAEEAGDFLSHGELLAMLLLLLVAGHETTVNLIGNGLLALLRNPEQAERLRTDESIERSAVEEFLRYDSPVQFTGRLVMEDFELSGHQIKKGTGLSTIVASANRDPEVFSDPDVLDLGRDPCPHLSFSAGIHYCLGAQLARLEGQIALSTVVRRFPNMKIATEDLEWRPAPILRGLVALPVTF
jgi:pimeloyl-[acyl-carrier protein] synthase